MSVKIIKIVMWILLLYILQTVFANLIDINGILPELLFSFSVIYAFREKSFVYASYIIVICAILSGSMIEGSFPMTVIIVGVAGIASFYFKNIAKFIPGIWRCTSLIAVSTFLLGAGHCFIVMRTINTYSLVTEIIPYTIYTSIVSIIMYPLIWRVLFKERSEKELLIL